MDYPTLLRALRKPSSNGTHTDTGPHFRPDDPECLKMALALLDCGVSVIPLCPPDHSGKLPPGHTSKCKNRGKHPVRKWEKYQTQRPTVPELRNWWGANPALNLGVVTGAISGLVVIDVDGRACAAKLLELSGGELPRTLQFGTSPGRYHLVFRWPTDRPAKSRAIKCGEETLSILADGRQTVFPPSTHKSGSRYGFTNLTGDTAVSLADAPGWLLELCSPQTRPARTAEKRTTRGGRRVGDRDRLMARVSDWVAGAHPSIEGQYGSGDLYHLCCALVHGYHLDRETARDWLVNEYNPRCQPPWPDKEIDHTLDNAMKYGNYRDLLNEPVAAVRSDTALSLPRAGSADPLPEQPSDAPLIVGPEAHQPDPDGPGEPAASTPSNPTGQPARVTPPALPGRLASELVELPTEWLLKPYFPRGMLSLVAGHPGTGKSALAAYLMTRARRVVLLPGFEEDLNRMLLPRLRANGIDLCNVRLLDKGDWRLPAAEDRLAEVVKGFGADLLLADPIGSYMADGAHENDGQHVREFLESFARTAEQTGAAVVGIRHPGKDLANVMPGSREWAAVPRSIVELFLIPGPPEYRIIRPFKDSLGQNAPARYFTLPRLDGGPPVFQIGGQVDAGTVELARLAPDLVERTKIDRALELIPRLLAASEMEAKDVYAAGLREALNDKVMDRAAVRLGVIRNREGNGKNHRCLWSMPKRDTNGD